MKLGKYFSLSELTVTNSGLENNPSAKEIGCLTELVKNILDPARELLDDQIRVNSGYRSPMVNRKIGGAASSQHVLGQAADLKCDDNAKLFNLIRKNLPFDQLINENNYSWIHVSYSKGKNRNEVLEFKNGKYKKL